MVKQKGYLTEEEHLELVRIGNLFWEEFSKMCAKHIAMMPSNLESITTTYLGDQTSIYGSNYDKYLKTYRKGE